MKLDIISKSTFPGFRRISEDLRREQGRHLTLQTSWFDHILSTPEEHSHSVFKLISQDKSKPNNKPCAPL